MLPPRAQQVRHQAERAAHSPWIERAAALGFIAKGVVYGIVGYFALKLALGDGGAILGLQDTPGQVKRQPFGDLLVGALGVGLACHALWRFVQAGFQHDPRDPTWKSAGKRIGHAGQGAVSAALAVTAFQHLLGKGRGGGGGGSWVHKALTTDGGEWVLIAAGVGFIAAGAYQLYKAYTAKFRKKLRTQEMSPREEKWLVRISRFGIAARGAVLPVAGWLLIQTGRRAKSDEEVGLSAAMREIVQKPWGEIMLGVVAVGLVAYGVYQLVNARYRRAFA